MMNYSGCYGCAPFGAAAVDASAVTSITTQISTALSSAQAALSRITTAAPQSAAAAQAQYNSIASTASEAMAQLKAGNVTAALSLMSNALSQSANLNALADQAAATAGSAVRSLDDKTLLYILIGAGIVLLLR
jgi:hypothetical protein